jgi:hypothetical protein
VSIALGTRVVQEGGRLQSVEKENESMLVGSPNKK